MFGIGSGKGGVLAGGHIGGHRLFVQQIQHTVGTGEHLRQAGSEVGQCHHRPEGAESRQGADQDALGSHPAGLIQVQAYPQHGQCGAEDEGIGHAHGHTLAVLQGGLLPTQRLALGGDACGTAGCILILQGVLQTAQAFEDIAVGVGQSLPILPCCRVAPFGRPDRQGCTHQQIACEQNQGGQNVITCCKAKHPDYTEECDAEGGNGVSVKDFQRLNVGGDEGDQVAPIPPFQFGGGQAAECAKDLIADQSQQLEGDVVVGSLLCIPQNAAQQRKDKDAGEGCAHRPQRAGQPGGGQNAEAAENGDEGGAEMPGHAHPNGRQHDGQHGLDEDDQPPDDLQRAAVCGVLHADTSPRVSSCFCA